MAASESSEVRRGLLDVLHSKKPKQRFCILHSDGRFCVYESEKHFRKGQIKLSLHLKSLFNLNYRLEPRMCEERKSVTLFTTKDSLVLCGESEEATDAWFEELYRLTLQVRLKRAHDAKVALSEAEAQRTLFAHCWEVEVVKHELGAKNPELVGPARLVLSQLSLNLYPRQAAEDEERSLFAFFEFARMSIRNYGYNRENFSMELGSSSQLGSGSIWMKTGHPEIPKLINKAIAETSAANANMDCFREDRTNSISTVERRGTRSRLGTGSSGGSFSSSQLRTRTHSDSERKLQKVQSMLSSRQSDASSCGGEGIWTSPRGSEHSLSQPNAAASSTSASSSPPATFGWLPPSAEAAAISPRSAAAASAHFRAPSNDLTPPNPPTILEEPKDSEYTNMGRRQTTTDSAYSPLASPEQEDYTRMGPSKQASLVLEEVRSYISDSGDSCYSSTLSATQPHPSTSASIRAYSLGSKPLPPKQPHPRASASSQVSPSQHSSLHKPLHLLSDEERKRAHSVGSKWLPATIRKFSGSLVPPFMEEFRNRSGSTGSGKKGPELATTRVPSFGGTHSEDLLEMDFGAASAAGAGGHRCSSGSLGSSESLSRSRASSVVGGVHGWSPRTDENPIAFRKISRKMTGGGGGAGMTQSVSCADDWTIKEDESPSQKLISRLLADQEEARGDEYLEMGKAGAAKREAGGVQRGSSGGGGGEEDYLAMSRPGGDDYTLMGGSAGLPSGRSGSSGQSSESGYTTSESKPRLSPSSSSAAILQSQTPPVLSLAELEASMAQQLNIETPLRIDTSESKPAKAEAKSGGGGDLGGESTEEAGGGGVLSRLFGSLGKAAGTRLSTTSAGDEAGTASESITDAFKRRLSARQTGESVSSVDYATLNLPAETPGRISGRSSPNPSPRSSTSASRGAADESPRTSVDYAQIKAPKEPPKTPSAFK